LLLKAILVRSAFSRHFGHFGNSSSAHAGLAFCWESTFSLGHRNPSLRSVSARIWSTVSVRQSPCLDRSRLEFTPPPSQSVSAEMYFRHNDRSRLESTHASFGELGNRDTRRRDVLDVLVKIEQLNCPVVSVGIHVQSRLPKPRLYVWSRLEISPTISAAQSLRFDRSRLEPTQTAAAFGLG